MALVMTTAHLELRKRDEPKLGGIFVDFAGGAMAHRRKFGGGRGEAVAKAVGIKGDYLPDVVDATAGLGRDAFVLASVGCRVRMLERTRWLLRCLTMAWRAVMPTRKSAVAAGAFAVDSRVEPDGVNRYHTAPAGGVPRPDVPA
ncbi:class I SAM-dependent methyltransferase [Shigella flexneri]